jgi:SAM-dependent methyltransferase
MRTQARSTRLLDRVLGVPAIYGHATRLIRGGWRSRYVREHVQPSAGDRILDLGCGVADVLDALPLDVRYVGVDADARYIAHARRRHGSRAQFVCARLDRDLTDEFKGFDLVMANGVLHHLDDANAADLFAIARAAVRGAGRLVTIDGCYVTSQSPVVRFLLKHDRGQFVRSRAGYERLARATFGDVRSSVHQNLIRIPYTHLIMVCRP